MGIDKNISIPYNITITNKFQNELISSYRIKQGVLHNPLNDRRTTKGVFHVAEGGLPIPDDKKAVPKVTFARLLERALQPPESSMRLPFTAGKEEEAKTYVSLMLRPLVCPEVPGMMSEKKMEIRFFVPGSMVSNLDFVESIFGNAGDPTLFENDAALDTDHWSGHTGCVILAPHLKTFTKKELGLPHQDDATERQIKDGMCWSNENEIYNDGGAFKICCRTDEGVSVTLIADNYFGYCKKEVKTMIGYAANLFGMAEEEHAGGALAFPCFNLGDQFIPRDEGLHRSGHSYEEVLQLLGDRLEPQTTGYAIDKKDPSVFYMHESMVANLPKQQISWTYLDKKHTIKLNPNCVYFHPTGYRIRMEKHGGAPTWRIVGTEPEGTLCHKPCTVSGGGKSEISKSLHDSIIYGPFFVADYEEDLKLVKEIFNKDYASRFRVMRPKERPSRTVWSEERSLGSVIKLLTPSAEIYNDEYNQWLESIPHHIKALVFIIKRFYNPKWGKNWEEFFSVDTIDGNPAHEFKYKNRKLVAQYLRIGYAKDSSWQTYKLRQDFMPADKVQFEDDISASIVINSELLPGMREDRENGSVKLVKNCEYRLFQRPDEAIHPGGDQQAEIDLSSPNSFLSNYEPLEQKKAVDMANNILLIDKFTPPMANLIRETAADANQEFFACNNSPRIVDGVPTKNPRYLQIRPDVVEPRNFYVAEMGVRLQRRIGSESPVVWPIHSVITGRRNNPADYKIGIRPLSVFNPIHYQELPELFMDFVSSLTGKSPSTTGAGSEGALTKGPFNCLCAVTDLNNALLSYILTDYNGYSTSAGYVGNVQVDHDISLMIPELWCRLSAKERNPNYLIEQKCLEPIVDYEYEGEKILASRLGYRITKEFLYQFCGKLFDNPMEVFTDEMLRPELQDEAAFADGIKNITETQTKVALAYFRDGSVEGACPPLKALLHIMAYGEYEGKDVHHPEIREMFTKEYLMNSDWYKERLHLFQGKYTALWERHRDYLEAFIAQGEDRTGELEVKLQEVQRRLKEVQSDEYLKSLEGSLGADPLYRG